MKNLLFILIGLLLSNKEPKQITPQQEKKYVVSLTLLDWDTTLQSMNNNDDVALNARKRIAQNILSQIQQQLSYEKHISDSLSKIKK